MQCKVQCSAVYSAVQCSVQCSAVQVSVQCSAVQVSAGQCTVQCSAVQCRSVYSAAQCSLEFSLSLPKVLPDCSLGQNIYNIKAKAISAELFELILEVQSYNPVINRPGVAGAVLQTPLSLIHLFIQ